MCGSENDYTNGAARDNNLSGNEYERDLSGIENKQSFGIAPERPMDNDMLSDKLEVTTANNDDDSLDEEGKEKEPVVTVMETQAADVPSNIEKAENGEDANAEGGGFYNTVSYYFGGWFGYGENPEDQAKAQEEGQNMDRQKDTAGRDLNDKVGSEENNLHFADIAIIEKFKTSDRTPMGEELEFNRAGGGGGGSSDDYDPNEDR